MKLGMPTLIELKDLKANALLAVELGLDFIELNMCLPTFQTEMFHTKELMKTSQQYGLFYTIHMDELFDPFTFNRYTRKAFFETLCDTFNATKELCVPIFNMHLSQGTYFTLPDRKEFLYQNYYGTYLKHVKEFRTYTEDMMGGGSASLCIENTDGFSPFQKDAIALLLQSPIFGLTYDYGHDHSNTYYDRAFMLSHQERIRHVHIHNAIGKRNHLALGIGEIDIRQILDFVQAQESRGIPMHVVVETKTVEALRQSIPLVKRLLNTY